MKNYFLILLSMIVIAGCTAPGVKQYESADAQLAAKVAEFIPVTLTTDLSQLTEKEQQMMPLLFEVAKIMDGLFWKQAWGDKQALLDGISDENLKKFVLLNYGPWERLNGNQSFVTGIGEKPKGATFYPADMTKEEFDALEDSTKMNDYTVIRRDAEGKLIVVPYHVEYAEELGNAASLLRQAAELAEDEGLKKYLLLRADAFMSGNYFESDMAWMVMKTNTIDFVAGPIETYEDALYGYKTAFEAYLLVKDKEWSEKLARFSALLPMLQQSLPVEQAYKSEVPGADSDMGAYEVLYYGGDCNAGSKTIAINLPNDPRVQLAKGSRKLQLKNSMKAKFDHILVPISEQLIVPEQLANVKFDAFFENTMFHEVAHGLGIKNTINGKGEVKNALMETASPIEEGKADILGLYMVTKLAEMGEMGEKDLMDNYVTFMAGIFRSVRFGAASAHGKANMMRFNYFQDNGAFTYDEQSGLYKVDFEKMKEAVNSLSAKILTMQGNGDYEAARKWLDEKGNIPAQLQAGLDKIAGAGIPRDIVFNQGPEVLGLK